MSAAVDHAAQQREIRRHEEIEAAREWIEECHWSALTGVNPYMLTPGEVRHLVERRYVGGWLAFVEDQVGS